MFDVHAYADFFGLYWNVRNEIILYLIKWVTCQNQASFYHTMDLMGC